MKFANSGAVCLLLMSLSDARCAPAQSQAAQADVKAFVAQYVAAFNAKDMARIRALYHPKSLACITPENKSYYDDFMALHLRDPIPANYTFTVAPVNEDNVKVLESMGRFPVKPDLELNINYQQGDDVGNLVVVYLVRENGRLLVNEPCASDQTMKQYRDDSPDREKRAAHYKAIAAGIQEPLRSQLIALLREHKTSEATRRYKEASMQDYGTAILVIDALVREVRQ